MSAETPITVVLEHQEALEVLVTLRLELRRMKSAEFNPRFTSPMIRGLTALCRKFETELGRHVVASPQVTIAPPEVPLPGVGLPSYMKRRNEKL